MDVATVVDILFLHIFLTGKTGKVDMFNILYATIPYMP